jgi:hypothetical protein
MTLPAASIIIMLQVASVVKIKQASEKRSLAQKV